MQPIVEFYEGHGTDAAGRKLNDILAWDDEMLEVVHDYIQWLFPLRDGSQINPQAPRLDSAQMAEFFKRRELRTRVHVAFSRMLAFYGLRHDMDGTVKPSPTWPTRSANWLTPYNHNFMRITRILTSLRLLGLDAEAKAFFAALDDIAKGPYRDVIGSSYEHWKQAVAD